MWVRVKDRGTGHEFDVPEGDPRIGVVFDQVKSERFPLAHQPRPPKHRLDLADQSAARPEPTRRAARKSTTKEQ